MQRWLFLREASPADQVHFYSQYFLQMWDIPQETRMLWWEGQRGGERHHARHHTNTSAASTDHVGSRGEQHGVSLL